ncbi:hypothetical protein TREES_T100002597 [Tupaia chinensis]|uniref:Uncharacterized protein n=1 Tax=Tupaia chinensis TaxID=246437 RepID=L9L5Y5_TUPCH|nr:hypothetical protein TREES_T100002597 [Tupaia chinensis]
MSCCGVSPNPSSPEPFTGLSAGTALRWLLALCSLLYSGKLPCCPLRSLQSQSRCKGDEPVNLNTFDAVSHPDGSLVESGRGAGGVRVSRCGSAEGGEGDWELGPEKALEGFSPEYTIVDVVKVPASVLRLCTSVVLPSLAMAGGPAGELIGVDPSGSACGLAVAGGPAGELIGVDPSGSACGLAVAGGPAGELIGVDPSGSACGLAVAGGPAGELIGVDPSGSACGLAVAGGPAGELIGVDPSGSACGLAVAGGPAGELIGVDPSGSACGLAVAGGPAGELIGVDPSGSACGLAVAGGPAGELIGVDPSGSACGLAVAGGPAAQECICFRSQEEDLDSSLKILPGPSSAQQQPPPRPLADTQVLLAKWGLDKLDGQEPLEARAVFDPSANPRTTLRTRAIIGTQNMFAE